MHARVAYYQFKPGKGEEAAKKAEQGLLPIFRKHAGFHSYETVLTGGDTGYSISTWENEQQATEAVTDPAGGGDPDRQAQEIAGDHPLQVRRARSERLTERRQGDVDDRQVHEVQEQAGNKGRGDQVLIGNVFERHGAPFAAVLNRVK